MHGMHAVEKNANGGPADIVKEIENMAPGNNARSKWTKVAAAVGGGLARL